VPGKGLGLVVTEDVKAGTLLLVSKAVVRTCIEPESEEGRRISKLLSMDRVTNYVEKTSYYTHAVDAMHTVMRNPQLTKEFYSLWAGEQGEGGAGQNPAGCCGCVEGGADCLFQQLQD
jgi:hypothetical protein